MPFIREIFDNLAYGELANLAVGNANLGTIAESSYPKVASHINLALLELYKKFTLSKRECKIHQYPGVTTYYLRSDRAGEATSLDDYYYLEDTMGAPFEDDVLKIVQAFNANGDEIRLNDPTETMPIYTPTFDTVKMVPLDPPDVISFVYRARYPKIVVDEYFNPDTYELHIPPFIEEALFAYVAARMYKPVSSDGEGGNNPSNTYMAQYELAVKKIEMASMEMDDNEPSGHFTKGGWA